MTGMKLMMGAITAFVIGILLCAFVSSLVTMKRKEARRFGAFCAAFVGNVKATFNGAGPIWTVLGRDLPSRHKLIGLANIAEGTWMASVNKLSDAAITTKNLLYKKGSDDDHVAVCGANDVPLGTINDEIDADDLTDVYLAVHLLGRGPTKKMVASEAIGAGVDVYAAAAGKVATTGSVWVGISITAASGDGETLTVNDSPGQRGTGLNTIVAATVAAAGTTVADAAQLGNARVTRITSDGAAKGVKLPTGVAGMERIVINTSGTAAELYAATGGTVNGLAANASVVIPASKGLLCICTAADTWTAFDLTALATAS